jgi:GT2 family glycosyltransferase
MTLPPTHPKLAILLTCYNRREQTLACLQRLSEQSICGDIYLVDDGSSDGTAEAVARNYPQVKLLRGDGNLYWVGGMHLAFGAAMQQAYDYYLWLNDDTLLVADAISILLQTHSRLAQQGDASAIVAGSVQDPRNGRLTYGGRRRPQRWFSRKFEPVLPSQEPQRCDTMQGNIVLIPHSVTERIGNVDPVFIHNFGDLDYGLRAVKSGCSVWIAPGFLGSCAQNSVRGSWADTSLSVLDRLRKVIQVKAFPPKVWTIYLKRHSGPFWMLFWFLPYIRAVIGYRNLDESPTFCND